MSNDFQDLWESARAHARDLQKHAQPLLERARSSADKTNAQTSTKLDEFEKVLRDGAGAAKKGADFARPHVRRLLEHLGLRFN